MRTCATHSRVCAHDVPVQFKRFNISVSYYQVAALLCKDTKFGKTMVIKTAKYSGAYTLGFRIDPPERCIKTMQRVNGLLSVYCIAPVFGIQFEQEEAPYVVLSPPPPSSHSLHALSCRSLFFQLSFPPGLSSSGLLFLCGCGMRLLVLTSHSVYIYSICNLRWRSFSRPPLEDLTVNIEEDDVRIVGDDDDRDHFAAYLAEAQKADGAGGLVERKPVYSMALGLAIEELRPGLSIKKLWEINT